MKLPVTDAAHDTLIALITRATVSDFAWHDAEVLLQEIEEHMKGKGVKR